MLTVTRDGLRPSTRWEAIRHTVGHRWRVARFTAHWWWYGFRVRMRARWAAVAREWRS
jgi:hypothetical protein